MELHRERQNYTSSTHNSYSIMQKNTIGLPKQLLNSRTIWSTERVIMYVCLVMLKPALSGNQIKLVGMTLGINWDNYAHCVGTAVGSR